MKGATLMLGYLGAPLDETLDEEGVFVTRDGGWLDAEGRLFWEGRLNDIIRIGGADVFPAKFDAAVRACSGVTMTRTVGLPHPTHGEMVVARVVPAPGTALSEEAAKAFARETLASYKTPRRVLFFDEADLQLTASAKMRIADLRKLALERLEADNGLDAPASAEGAAS